MTTPATTDPPTIGQRFTSRKFLITVAGLAALVTAKWTSADSSLVVTLCSAFIVAEGAADGVSRWKAPELAEKSA